MSMRALARRLDVGVSTLYYHVASREELVTLIADRVLEQLKLPMDDPQRWRPAMLQSGRALRMIFGQRVAMAENALRDPAWGDTIIELHEQACAFLVRAGFSAGDAFMAVRTIADLVEAHTIRAHHHARAGFTDLEYAARSQGQYPTLQRAQADVGNQLSSRRFEFALRAFVRGIKP